MDKKTRVYFRVGEQIVDKEKPGKLTKPVLKMRPLDANNIPYFTESTRRGRNG